MGMNDTPSSERIHIGIFGKRNAGKSSLINALTGQDLAIVSEIAGTTTDPVSKAMELLPLGPVVLIDTPGLDDEGELGKQRVRSAKRVMNRCDAAILVIDGLEGLCPVHTDILSLFRKKNIPYLVVHNKNDLAAPSALPDNAMSVSAKTGAGIWELKERLSRLVIDPHHGRRLVGDLLQPHDIAVLVVPIDSAAPKGRLILPQQQTIRDVLESGAYSVVVRESELPGALDSLGRKPRIVITDSQAFGSVSKDTPEDIPLTSFSILMARYKGNLTEAVRGVRALDTVQDGDRILISEGCTHHRQCDDIGTVKLPRWIEQYTGKKLEYAFTSGGEFPEDLSPYHMVIHCGGCMLNEREMKSRIAHAIDEQIPMTNYGIAIAYMHGILARSVAPFPNIAALLKP
ncbi:MAG: [FeFe] hydrogenase H-cluster maturation GTPase HydF [Eubacteriales bacterium]|nr:[FeFe] hydrogenase H-cluster maturation GTPase HydF [Eubacteriales bacterium]